MVVGRVKIGPPRYPSSIEFAFFVAASGVSNSPSNTVLSCPSASSTFPNKKFFFSHPNQLLGKLLILKLYHIKSYFVKETTTTALEAIFISSPY